MKNKPVVNFYFDMLNDELHERKEYLSKRLEELDNFKIKIKKICDMHEQLILKDIEHYKRSLETTTSSKTIELLEELIYKSITRKMKNEETQTEYLSQIEQEYNNLSEEYSNLEEEIERED